MKKYENGEYIELSDEEIGLIEKEKDEYLSSASEKEDTANTADSIKEKVTGKTLILKDASSGMEKVVVKGTGVTSETKLNVVGRNVWNETCFLQSGTARLSSLNDIPVVPGLSYYFYCDSPLLSVEEYDTDLFMNIVYFDSNKKKLPISPTISMYRNSVITMPEGCYYIKFELHEAYGSTYKNDICISVADEKTNGTYTPYSKEEYSFDSNGNAVIPAPITPNMTLFTDDGEVVLECEYKKDIKDAIADTVADAIASAAISSENDWELISSGELTEEVSSLVLDGFSCSKIVLALYVKGSETNTAEDTLHIRTNKNANAGGGSDKASLTRIFRKDSTETVRVFIPLEFKSKWITGQLFSSAGAKENYINQNAEYDSITGLYLQPVTSGIVFGVGTTYELWGVRE